MNISGNITKNLEKDLELCSAELLNEIVRAERELELEHSHLKSLIDKNNPELMEQMSAMEDSISRLYNGLEKAVMYIQLAQGESYILKQELQNCMLQSPPPASSKLPSVA